MEASRRGRWLGGTAGGTAAEELQPVTLDLIAGATGQFAHDVAYCALAQVLDSAARGADQVVVVAAAAAEPVVKAAIVQEHPADGARFSQELHRSEDGGAPDTWNLGKDIVHAEVTALIENGRHHRQPRGCEAMAFVLEPLQQGAQCGCGHY